MDWTGARCLGLLACLAVLAASCSTATNSAEHEPDGGRGGDVGNVPIQPGFESASPSPDGELRLALARPETYLPSELSPVSQEAVIVADLLFDGLTEADPTRSQLRPGLATNWSANDDATAWTFTLDTDRAQPSEVVSYYQALRSSAAGAAAVALESVRLIEAVDERRVRFDLDTPNAGFPWLLSGVALSMAGNDNEPTGRYEVETNDETTLVLEPVGDDRPRVVVTWHGTARDAYNQLTLGVADAAVAPADALDDARSRYGATPPARAISRFYVVNTRSERVTDPQLREALLLAIDRSAIVADTVDVPAFALDGVLAPTLAGYERSGCGRACNHNPEQAGELIRVATVSGPDTAVEIRIGATPDQEPAAEALARDLAEAGFSPVVSIHDPERLAAVVGAGEIDLFAAGWVAPASSLDAVVPLILAADSPVGVHLGTATARATLDDAARTLDDDARWALLADAHREAVRTGIIVPIAVAKSYLVLSPEAPAIPTRADGTIDLVGFE